MKHEMQALVLQRLFEDLYRRSYHEIRNSRHIFLVPIPHDVQRDVRPTMAHTIASLEGRLKVLRTASTRP